MLRTKKECVLIKKGPSFNIIILMVLRRNHHKERYFKSWHAVKYLSNYEWRHCVNFWPFQPFYLRRSAMFLIWCAAEIYTIKEEFTQAILSLIHVYFGYLLVVGLNKIPCLLFLWTIINIHDVYDLKGIYYLVLFLAFLSVSMTHGLVY